MSDHTSCCILYELEGSDQGCQKASQESVVVFLAGQSHHLDQELDRVGGEKGVDSPILYRRTGSA